MPPAEDRSARTPGWQPLALGDFGPVAQIAAPRIRWLARRRRWQCWILPSLALDHKFVARPLAFQPAACIGGDHLGLSRRSPRRPPLADERQPIVFQQR